VWVPPAAALRPLSVSDRIDASWKIWARNIGTMARAMLVIAVPAGVVEAAVTLSTEPNSGVTTSTFGTTSSVSASSAGTSLAGSSINTIIGLIVAALAVTTPFNIVAATYVGQAIGWRQAVRSGARRMWSAVWISVLSTLVVLGLATVVVLVVVIVRAVSSLGVAVLVAAVLGLPVFGLLIWFSTCAQLATPALMLENVRGRAAILRAIRLVRGTWWSVFGSGLLMGLLVGIGTGILSVFFLVALVAVGGHSVAGAVLTFVLRTIILVVLTPLTATLSVVLLIDMRVRKEGLDLVSLATTLGTTVGTNPLPFVRQVVYGQPGTYGPPGWYGQPGTYGPPGGYGPPGAYGPPGGYGPGAAPPPYPVDPRQVPSLPPPPPYGPSFPRLPPPGSPPGWAQPPPPPPGPAPEPRPEPPPPPPAAEPPEPPAES
jgi:hypothetical protein